MSYFLSSVETISGSASVETPLVYINNPIDSGVALDGIEIGVNLLDTSNSAIFRLYLNPTIAEDGLGTSLTIYPQLQGDTTTSQIQVSYNPTVSSNGIVAKHFSIASNSSSPEFDLEEFGVSAGYSFLITCTSFVSSAPLSIDLYWAEG